MTRHRFAITLNLQGPILTKSSSPAAFGVDAAVARVPFGPGAGTPCIPGTLIKGKLREALDQFKRAGAFGAFGGADQPNSPGGVRDAELEDWFGRDTEPNTGNDPARGRLHFGDLVAKSNPRNQRARHGIALEPILGSAKGGMLRVIETPFATGEEVEFTGFAWWYGGNAGEVCQKLRLALLWLTHVGAERTTGFGRVLGAEIKIDPDLPPEITIYRDAVALDVTIKPLGPLCVSKHKIGGNLYESEEFIPGNMIAGALMETARAIGGSITHFDDLIFRHAFPCREGGERPKVLPLSTVCVGAFLYDTAMLEAPHLLKNEKDAFEAPAFSVDWKGGTWEEAEAQLGIVHPETELRVRTAIDSEHRTGEKGDAATGGALFAWQMVHPWTGGSNPAAQKPLVWKTRIELGAITDSSVRAAVANELAGILPSLGFLSKTKAACEVLIRPAPAGELPAINAGEPLALVLCTPALLADPRFQSVPGVSATDGAIAAAEMLALYRTVWSELSGQCLELSHHFARQILAGGNHLALRFQLKAKNGARYDPWLLTAPGSVFVFTVTDAAGAKARVEHWLNQGLPLPGWAKARYGDLWNQNPYRPQNGFGEVTIHRPVFAFPQNHQAEPIALADPILP